MKFELGVVAVGGSHSMRSDTRGAECLDCGVGTKSYEGTEGGQEKDRMVPFRLVLLGWLSKAEGPSPEM